MALNDVHRFTAVGSHAGTELAMVTLHMRETSGVAEVSSAASGIRSTLLAAWAASQAIEFRWDMILTLTVNATPPRSQEYTTSFPVQGALGTSLELPHQVAMVITKKTAYAGRSYRGRLYIPALTETGVTAGLFAGTAVSNVQTAWDNFLALYGASGSDSNWRFVVWSEKLQTANNVTAIVVRTIPGVVRRRRVGIGQ